MNHKEVVIKVSEMSGVPIKDCDKVLHAFEKVLTDELSKSKNIGNAVDKIFKITDFLKGKIR